MRSYDKKKNIEKANLLAEQRYLKSKGLLKENELDFFSDGEDQSLDLTPITTQRDSKGFRYYQLTNDDNVVYAEKDNVVYATDDMGKPTYQLRMSKLKINGLIDDKSVSGVDKFHHEKQGLGRIRKSFGVDENQPIGEETISQFEYQVLEAYLEAALWTEQDELDSEASLSDEARDSATNDIRVFIQNAGDLLQEMDPAQIGHDLWLTRNGHGAGFWDRGLGEKGDLLSNIARKMGSKDLYAGDDGQLYFS